MPSVTIQFKFEPDVSLAEAEMSLHLAMFAVEGLIGRVRVRLDAKYQVDEADHAIAVDAGSPTGRLIVRVFTGLLLREIGEQAFRVERQAQLPQHQPQEILT